MMLLFLLWFGRRKKNGASSSVNKITRKPPKTIISGASWVSWGWFLAFFEFLIEKSLFSSLRRRLDVWSRSSLAEGVNSPVPVQGSQILYAFRLAVLLLSDIIYPLRQAIHPSGCYVSSFRFMFLYSSWCDVLLSFMFPLRLPLSHVCCCRRRVVAVSS